MPPEEIEFVCDETGQEQSAWVLTPGRNEEKGNNNANYDNLK
jgi:hypothetical protein